MKNVRSIGLFRFSNEDGEIRPDEIACLKAVVPIENAHFTIEKLGLNVQRLKEQRLTVIELITTQIVNGKLKDETIDLNDLKEKLAAKYFRDGASNWPKFFTTIRWVLGAGAERHLIKIDYSG